MKRSSCVAGVARPAPDLVVDCSLAGSATPRCGAGGGTGSRAHSAKMRPAAAGVCGTQVQNLPHTWEYSPVPGERKSGMPADTLTPAPHCVFHAFVRAQESVHKAGAWVQTPQPSQLRCMHLVCTRCACRGSNRWGTCCLTTGRCPSAVIRTITIMCLALPALILAATPSRSNESSSGGRCGAARRPLSIRSTPSSCSACSKWVAGAAGVVAAAVL